MPPTRTDYPLLETDPATGEVRFINRDRLAADNWPLAWSTYRRWRRSAANLIRRGYDSDDLLSDVMLGFADAVRGYDPRRDRRLATLVSVCARYRVLHGAKAPTAARRGGTGYTNKAQGTGNTWAAIATVSLEEMGLRLNRREQDRFYDPPDHREADPADAAAAGVVECAERLLSFLDPRLRAVLVGRFWGGKTLQQLADEEGVTRERIRQLESRALRRLRLLLAWGDVPAPCGYDPEFLVLAGEAVA